MILKKVKHFHPYVFFLTPRPIGHPSFERGELVNVIIFSDNGALTITNRDLSRFYFSLIFEVFLFALVKIQFHLLAMI